jgi:hypothetical protein
VVFDFHRYISRHHTRVHWTYFPFFTGFVTPQIKRATRRKQYATMRRRARVDRGHTDVEPTDNWQSAGDSTRSRGPFAGRSLQVSSPVDGDQENLPLLSSASSQTEKSLSLYSWRTSQFQQPRRRQHRHQINTHDERLGRPLS